MMEDSKRIRIEGKAVSVDGDDIDTDRIIPARYLRCVTFDGLGEHAFEDERKQTAESGGTHPFDDPAQTDARVLLVNKNFGCGSSREHAPQALMRWNRGVAAIVGESFAEIFFGNCVVLGVPCLVVSAADMASLKQAAATDRGLAFEVDLEALQVRAGDVVAKATMPDGPRRQLLNGRWDSTAELLQGEASIAKVANALPYSAW
jgi:3-isopropylmalate/(R)-2-methylmalate dehydratase small subunit